MRTELAETWQVQPETGESKCCLHASRELSNPFCVSPGQLRRAILRRELSVEYQGKWDLLTGRLTGVEALARWHLPGVGRVPPSIFIPIAEQDHSIRLLGDFVLDSVLAQIRQWDLGGVHIPHVAVNLSPDELNDPGLVRSVVDAVDKAHVNHGRIQFEITESIAIQEFSCATEALVSLNNEGFSLAIDDFGTGYSNLSGLRYLPIETIKIDRSFTRASTASKAELKLLEAIILLARSLDLETVAEGIESLREASVLRDLGCQTGQGFYFSAPKSGHVVCRDLQRSRDTTYPPGKSLS